MRALSIRQPYAELILRGIKRVEYRSQQTWKIGERFAIYVPLQPGAPQAWAMLETSQPGKLSTDPQGETLRAILPTGVIVGTAVISHCTPPSGEGEFGHCWQWHLTGVRRWKRPRKTKGRPQPVWFAA